MSKFMICLFALFPLLSQASSQDEQCANVGRYLESVTLTSVINDIKIDRSTVLEEKTQVELLGIFPVSDVLAKQLSDRVWQKEKSAKGANMLTKEEYYSTYHDDNVKSIAAKYIFINKEGKRNVVISLGYLNDNECSVDYGGYLTLAREF